MFIWVWLLLFIHTSWQWLIIIKKSMGLVIWDKEVYTFWGFGRMGKSKMNIVALLYYTGIVTRHVLSDVSEIPSSKTEIQVFTEIPWASVSLVVCVCVFAFSLYFLCSSVYNLLKRKIFALEFVLLDKLRKIIMQNVFNDLSRIVLKRTFLNTAR